MRPLFNWSWIIAIGCLCGCAGKVKQAPIVETALHVALPSNNREWSPDQAVVSTALFHDNSVTINNIRNCQYRSTDDYTVEHYNKTFDLSKIRSVDFILVPFAGAEALAHTMLSFGFEGNEYLCVSVEIRKERGEEYSPISGSLRQYEIMYVLGDERDLIGLRANHRMDDVYLYPVRCTPQQARAMFVDVLQRVNKLAVLPEFYDSITNNCTNNIVRHVNNVAPNRIPLRASVVLPGLSDRMAYELGMLNVEGPFEMAKQRARINRLAYIYRDDPDFSAKIRRR